MDDDVVVAMSLTMGLENTEVIEASRRGAGFERIRSTLPDAVVVDRRMPDGDGLQLVCKVRADAATSDIPIIVLTAGFDEADRAEVEEAGADAYLGKPFEPDELLAVIEGLIAARPPRKEPLPPLAPPAAEPADVAGGNGRHAVRTPLRAVTSTEGTGLPAPPSGRLGGERTVPAAAAAAAPAAAMPTAAVPPAPVPAAPRSKIAVDAVALGAAVARAEERAAAAEAEIETLKVALAEARDDNTRLYATVERLGAELHEARERDQESATRGQHLFTAADDLHAEVARAEADAQLLREQLVEARLQAEEAEQLRREVSKAYADIEVLETRLGAGEREPAPHKAVPIKRSPPGGRRRR